MSISLRSSVAALALVVFLISSASALSAEPRLFRNSEGKTIEATFEGIENGQITIRRTSDGQTFTLPATSFSIDDQAWIRDQVVAAAPSAAPGEWGRLKVELPNPLDYINIIGIRPNVSRYRTGAREYDLLLPVGAWVFVSVRSAEDPRELVEHLVQYKGGSHWKVTEDDLNLIVSRDGNPPRIVGITPPYDNPLRFVRRVDKNLLAEEVCLELPDIALIEEIHRIGAKVVAFTTDRAFDAEDLFRIAKAEPKALRLSLSANSVSGITAFDSLEALYVSSYNSSRNGTTIDSIQLPGLPNVRDLSLYAVPFNEDMGKSLIDHGRLRLFDFVMVSGSSSIDNPPTWEGVDQLAGTLEGLRVDYGLRMKGSDLPALDKLRHLSIGPSMYASSDFGSLSIPESGELRILEVQDPALSGNALGRWAEADLLKQVERLATYRLFEMSKAPKVEFLYMGGRSDSDTRTGVARLAPLSKLKRLSCLGLLDEDLPVLAGLPFASTLEALVLRNSKASDLNALSTLSSLRRLEMEAPQMRVAAINASIFPKLESLRSYQLPDLQSLPDVASHPTLTSLVIHSSPLFSSLGEPAENTVLRHLDFEGLKSLTDLSALANCTGITQLKIEDCDQIEDIRFLERNNELRYIWISDNTHLENQSASDLKR